MKNSTEISNTKFYIISFLAILLHQLIYQPFVGPAFNNYGDFTLFMEHWLIGKIWFNKNLFAVPWFSPTHCMAFPFYANPQNLFYSVSQLFFIFFSPGLALRLYFLFLGLVAYFGTYLFLRESFKLQKLTCILGATLFLLNGFFNERFMVAHFGTVVYVFSPLFLYLVNKVRNHTLKDRYFYTFTFLAAIILSQIIYGGAAALTIPIFYSMFVGLLAMLIFKFDKKIIISFMLAFVICFLISFSKIYAGIALLENYPRDFYYPLNSENILKVIETILINIFLAPAAPDPKMLPFSTFQHIHEMNYFISITPIIILIGYIILNYKNFKSLDYKNKKYLLLVLSVFLLIPVLLNHNNFLLDLTGYLPVVKHLWVSSRYFLIYIIPIIVASCIILGKINFKYKNSFIYLLLFTTFLHVALYPKDHYKFKRIAFFLDGKNVASKLNDKNYEIKNSLFVFKEKDFKKGKNDKKFQSDPLDINYVNLAFKILNHGSLFNCYEPILGYMHDTRSFRTMLLFPESLDVQKIEVAEIVKTSPWWSKDGMYNFINPICSLFPKENGCEKGDNFKISEKEKLANLLKFKPIKFLKSNLQKIADIISFITLLTVLSYLIVMLFLFCRRKFNDE